MFKKIAITFFLVILIAACSSSKEKETIINDSFDRGKMLINIADNIIIPAFNDFSVKMNTLKLEGQKFITTPNQNNLDEFRTTWLVAYKSWQHIEMFDIGKAEELQYKFYMNIYPLTVTDVESSVISGSYDLNDVNYQDAQGFPALDYLLYGVADSDAAILEKFTSDANATGYKKYTEDVLNQMNSLTQKVVADWQTYRNEFVNSTSNTVTSAVNKLVNDYIYYYEKGLRANKIGIPAGVFSATELPEKVEAYYKDNSSKELTLEALNAVINFFEGTYVGKTNTSAIGFKQYLIALDREDLASKITNQFSTAKNEINALDESFFKQINTDNIKMTRAYDELQKAVVLLKVDMLQTFNINVDYVDADGD